MLIKLIIDDLLTSLLPNLLSHKFIFDLVFPILISIHFPPLLSSLLSQWDSKHVPVLNNQHLRPHEIIEGKSAVGFYLWYFEGLFGFGGESLEGCFGKCALLEEFD